MKTIEPHCSTCYPVFSFRISGCPTKTLKILGLGFSEFLGSFGGSFGQVDRDLVVSYRFLCFKSNVPSQPVCPGVSTFLSSR